MNVANAAVGRLVCFFTNCRGSIGIIEVDRERSQKAADVRRKISC